MNTLVLKEMEGHVKGRIPLLWNGKCRVTLAGYTTPTKGWCLFSMTRRVSVVMTPLLVYKVALSFYPLSFRNRLSSEENITSVSTQ